MLGVVRAIFWLHVSAMAGQLMDWNRIKMRFGCRCTYPTVSVSDPRSRCCPDWRGLLEPRRHGVQSRLCQNRLPRVHTIRALLSDRTPGVRDLRREAAVLQQGARMFGGRIPGGPVGIGERPLGRARGFVGWAGHGLLVALDVSIHTLESVFSSSL